MKNTIYFLILLLGTILVSCDKDADYPDFNVTSEFLNQTCWKGTINRVRSDETIDKGEIGILFLSNKEGNCEYIFQGDKDSMHDIFQYGANGNIITFSNSESDDGVYLRGDWLVTEKSKKKLVLVRGMNNIHSTTTTLTLTRIY